MGAMTNLLQLDVLKKILHATNPSWDAATILYLSLHTADPTVTGNQSTSEVGYSGYARVAVSRDSSAWTISGQTIINQNLIIFPTSGNGTFTVTHIGLGTSASGTGNLLIRSPLTLPLIIMSTLTPSFAPGTLIASVT